MLIFQVDHTRVLDFDIKRKYFRTELERLDEGLTIFIIMFFFKFPISFVTENRNNSYK